MGGFWSLQSWNARKNLLLIASYIFYGAWNPPFALLLFATTTFDFWLGSRIAAAGTPQSRKIWLVASVTANLSMLGFFKYGNFLLENFQWLLARAGVDYHPPHLDIFLPIGISFYTFEAISYIVDIYRGRLKPERSLPNFLLFILFFPHLVAGPIVRARDFLPQVRRRKRFNWARAHLGVQLFLMGLLKKWVIADRMALFADPVFADPGAFKSGAAWLALFAYALQIYCDFSGYSDMAIGCARMMGFHFMENFQMPYSSLSITEFWRRWHISLSSWFRDYLYIPLGGSRKGTGRTYVNLLATMLLCGLWHGASWNFVFWGGLHGAALAIHRAWSHWNPLAAFKENPIFQFAWNMFARLLTLSVVLAGWIFFREHSWTAAWQYLSRIATWSHEGTRFASPYILAALAAVFLAHLLVPKDSNWSIDVSKRPVVVRALAYGALLFLIVCFGASDAAPFIYFQF
jgi:alginate O-acetyltransferase complex protein AlgI